MVISAYAISTPERLIPDNFVLFGKQIDLSVARFEVNQSKVVVTHVKQLPVCSIEIPVKDKQNFDLLKLDIQADKK